MDMILPRAEIIFEGGLQLFENAPMYGAATSRKLTVFGLCGSFSFAFRS